MAAVGGKVHPACLNDIAQLRIYSTPSAGCGYWAGHTAGTHGGVVQTTEVPLHSEADTCESAATGTVFPQQKAPDSGRGVGAGVGGGGGGGEFLAC